MRAQSQTHEARAGTRGGPFNVTGSDAAMLITGWPTRHRFTSTVPSDAAMFNDYWLTLANQSPFYVIHANVTLAELRLVSSRLCPRLRDGKNRLERGLCECGGFWSSHDKSSTRNPP